MKLETETFTTIDYVNFTVEEIVDAVKISPELKQMGTEQEQEIYNAFLEALTGNEDRSADSFAKDISAAVSCRVSINKDSSFTAIQALCNLTTDSINVATRELERETRNRFFFLCAYYVWACFVEDPKIDFGQVKQVLNWLLTPLERKAREYWANYDKQGRPEFKSN